MATLREDLLRPIAGDNPAGVFLRWDAADTTYDEIKAARTEEEDLPRAEWDSDRKMADWDAVVRMATDALAKRSKDLQLAGWLTEALLHRQGLPGLADGLDLLSGLLDEFWDSLYPELDEDGDAELRAAPLVWIGERLGESLGSVAVNAQGHTLVQYKQSRSLGYEKDVAADAGRRQAREQALAEGKLAPEAFDAAFDGTPKPWYRELMAAHEAAVAALDALEKGSEDRFGDAGPSYRPLREALGELGRVGRQLLDRKLEQDPDPPEPEPADEAAPTAAGGAGGGKPAARAASAEPRNEREAAAAIAAAARFLRRARPADPAPYALLRGYRWGELRAGDELDPKLLAAPPTETRTRLKTLLLDGEWSDLLDAVEEVMATPYGRGWLDLQRYALSACEALGGEYEAVAATVIEELRTLLRRRPELTDLMLMDDSPTANRETRVWLAEQQLLEADPEEAAPKVVRVRPVSRDVVDRALERARAGKAEEAIQLLMGALDQEKSNRARFLRRSQVTEIMVNAGMYDVARPILLEMVQSIEDHALDSWEAGDTVALPLALLYRCLEALDEDGASRQELYQRVCRLDPVQAMSFTRGNGSPAPDADAGVTSDSAGDAEALTTHGADHA